MPEVKFEAVAILVVLLPGFFCARIIQRLCVTRDQTELDKIVEALLYSFLIYVIFSTFPLAPAVALQPQRSPKTGH
jgi:hypothetical protein